MRPDRQPTRAEQQFIDAQERFEADTLDNDAHHFAPSAVNHALFEIRLVLWLCLAMLCIIAWRIW